MKRFIEITFLLAFLFCSSCFKQDAQFVNLSGIHDDVSEEIVSFLEDQGFTKVTYFFDNEKNTEGKWQLYPSLEIERDLQLINVMEMPDSVGYNYLILLDKADWIVRESIGPFYDVYIESVNVIQSKNEYQLKIKIVNPPDDDSRYSIYDYVIKRE